MQQRNDLTSFVNVGPAIARDLTRLGFTHRDDLAGQDAVDLYERLGVLDGVRHDPCVLDTFLSVVDQADGGEPRPWWTYTAQRKALLSPRRAPRRGPAARAPRPSPPGPDRR